MRRFLWILTALMLLWAGATGEDTGRRENPEAWIRSMLSEEVSRAGRETVQEWVDQDLTGTADGIGGWYILLLRRMEWIESAGAAVEGDGDDFRVSGTDYGRALSFLREKAEGETGSITKRERMALTLQALGEEHPFIRETLEAALRETTLMPLVFALHLINNGAAGEEAAEDVVRRLVSLQLADGGWAVIGEVCDVDCTAMCLQALAGCRGIPEAAEAIERGLTALSRVQQENGGFLGMGLESAESCAQVLLALCSLQIDPEKDNRFIRNENTVTDAMMRFRIEGNGFAHDLRSGQRNDTATVQCLSALAEYAAFLRGGGPWYVFDYPSWDRGGSPIGTRISWKGWGYLLAGVAALLGMLVALMRGKRNWRSYVFPLMLGIVLAAGIAVTEIESPEQHYEARRDAARERNYSTTISIRCDSVAGESEYAPADGEILPVTEIPMAEGETAFDQLQEAVRLNRLQMEYDGTVAGAYVRGIEYLYEYEFGNLSGWMFRVNGIWSDVGCSQYTLKDGDRVEWVYTINLGKNE